MSIFQWTKLDLSMGPFLIREGACCNIFLSAPVSNASRVCLPSLLRVLALALTLFFLPPPPRLPTHIPIIHSRHGRPALQPCGGR